MKIITNIQQEKENFLKWQFSKLTISASFSRANIYIKDAPEFRRKAFKKTLFYAINAIADDLQNIKNESNFLSRIRTVIHQSNNYDDILEGGKLRFGIAQKVVNLYLKYLWCAGLIEGIPLHFPLHRLIQKGTRDIISWTQLTEEDDDKYLAKLNELCPGEDKAEWELREYNKQFYNLK